MRSTLLLAALAAGAVDAFEKNVTVTDWTTTTVTQTVTASPVTVTVPAASQPPAPTSSVQPSTTAAPNLANAATAVANNVKSDLAKKDPAPAPEAEAEANPEAVPEEWSTTWEWSSTWATTWGGEEPATTMATTTSQAPAASPTNAYQSTALYNHNVHRSNHSCSSLDWDAKLEQSALTLANKCVYQHDTSIDGGGYGQNIGYDSADQVGVMISDMMYNQEYAYYPWSSINANTEPDMAEFEKWGHLSQIIWKGSTHVGCATVKCPSLTNVDSSSAVYFTVCNYSPAGNSKGEYLANVLMGGSADTYSAS